MGGRVVVGMGGNLGDVPAAFARAARRIGELRGVDVERRSALWRTAPVGPDAAQPWFWNAAIAVRVDDAVTPRGLLDALLAIEGELGRVRGAWRDGPRVVDLDLLWWDRVRVDEAGLTVPHARLAVRAFALAPLCEVIGDDAWIAGAGAAGVCLARAIAAGARVERVRGEWP